MITQIYENIINGDEVRKNLIELRQLLKDEHNQRAFFYELENDYSKLYELLKDEDAKVRKNTVLIMGELGVEAFMMPIYEAYQAEEKLFVKSDYLTALKQFDYEPILEVLKERLHELTTQTIEDSNKKHIYEEIRHLTEMVVAIEKPKAHHFNGYHQLSDIILLTNREHQQITLEQIKTGIAKTFNAGVLVRTEALEEVLQIRTFSDLLFRLNKLGSVNNDPIQAARAIYENGLLDFLNARHSGYPPYYFRIEMKTKMALDKKSNFAKKMSAELETLSHRALINSTSNYEFEIRLIENKEGQFNVLLKLYTIPDERFSYRQEAVAASIQPAQAALIAELAKPYLKEDAQVLDPFCGVGTMLIERNKVVPAHPMYGVDQFGEAIDKAIRNARRDDTTIHFINRDFFDFKHDYLFDEIFTNMPTRGGRKTEEEMAYLYENFFRKAMDMLKDGGIIVMYTRDPELVVQGLRGKTAYRILKNYEISYKEKAYVYILEMKK